MGIPCYARLEKMTRLAPGGAAGLHDKYRWRRLPAALPPCRYHADVLASDPEMSDVPGKQRPSRPEAKVVAWVKAHFEAVGAFVAPELSMGWGRADLVAFELDLEKCRARIRNGQFRSLDRADHYRALRHMPELESGDHVSIGALSVYLGRSASYVRASLVPFLERAGYAKRVGPGMLAKVNGFIPIAQKVIAIEAKVSDWRKGAIQAKRHRCFANRVYLALASEYVHRVDLELLQRHGIGLIAASSTRVDELLESPAMPPTDPDRHSFSAEWLWRYRRAAVLKATANASR